MRWFKGFRRRATEIVNIPHKPTPEGFKIWVLACYGYLFNWLFHAKGKDRGPVELDSIWVEYGFTPTESVPLILALHRDPNTGERLPPENKHILWFDNLFTTIPLLETLWELGIGAAGTVRTMCTKREEQWDSERGAAVSFHRKDSSSVTIESYTQLPLHHSTQVSVVEAYDSQTQSTGFSQSKFLPLSSQRKLATRQAIGGLHSHEKFSERLMDIKSTYTNQVLWGTQYWELSANKSVIQLAWKDAQIVLFASTVALPHEQVIWLPKRPAKTATGGTITRKVFGDQPVKFLLYPVLWTATTSAKIILGARCTLSLWCT